MKIRDNWIPLRLVMKKRKGERGKRRSILLRLGLQSGEKEAKVQADVPRVFIVYA